MESKVPVFFLIKKFENFLRVGQVIENGKLGELGQRSEKNLLLNEVCENLGGSALRLLRGLV